MVVMSLERNAEILSETISKCHDNQLNKSNKMAEIYKYSRSTLFSLKNNKLSIKKPECFFRPDLHSLGLWKVVVMKNERNRSSSTQQPKMRFFASGGMKYMEESNKPGFNTTMKKKFEPCSSSSIDPRSISSAHLLPAFAKRRLMSTSEINCNDFVTTPDESSDSEKQSKRETKDMNVNKNLDSRENNVFLDDLQTGNEDNFENHRQQNMSPISPTPSSSFKNGYHNNERRIGSGRFIPRDINWDHSFEQKKYPTGDFSKDYKSQIYKNNVKSFYCSDTKRNDSKDKMNANTSVNSEEILGNVRRETTNRRFPSKPKDIQNVQKLNHKTGGMDRNKRYLHQHYNEHFEEPEWFSEGPTSKLDTIELRGFEEIDVKPFELNLSKELNSDTLHESLELKDNSNVQQIGERNSTQSSPINNMNSSKSNEGAVVDNEKSNFNLDNFLSLDSLQSPLMNIETHYSGDTSRFSQWFINSSEKDDNADKNLNNEGNKEGLKVDNSENRTLIDFLKAGNITQTVSINKPLNVHSIPSVEELEARMRKINTQSENEIQINKESEDMDVFNRFLNQLKENTLQSSNKFSSNVSNDNSIHKKNCFQLQQQSPEVIPIYEEPSTPQPVFAPVELNSSHNANAVTGKRMNILTGHEVYMDNGALMGELVTDDHPLIEKKSDSAIPSTEEKICQNVVEKQLFSSSSIATPDTIKNFNTSPSYGHIPVPSPLSFTPTSVLRKMTAEKELHGQNNLANVNHVDLQNKHFYKTIVESGKVNNNTQMNFQEYHLGMMQNIIPRMILGGNSNTFLPTRQKDIANNVAASSASHSNSNHVMDHNKWNYHAIAPANIKSPKPLDVTGRPILKGNVQNMPLIQPLQHVQQHQPCFDHKMEYNAYHAEIMRRNQLNSQMFLQSQVNQPMRIMDHSNSPLNNPIADRQGMIARSFQPLEYVETLNNRGVNTFFDGHGHVTNVAANDVNGFQKDDVNNSQLNHWLRPPVLAHSNAVCRQQPHCEKSSALTLEEFEKKIQVHPSSTIVNH